ncbi:MAG: UvrD-helicase domain-containing protein [bacterium]|nr:UvrD-helicase domain-containing protein [bacterium]
MADVDTIILNDRQREAVTAPLGPVLVLAGPGTGKTRVLTERIRYLVEVFQIPPEQILALTFTNKAAGEMAFRLQRALGKEAAEAVTTGTFHRFCVGVLREHFEGAGLPEHFGIADEELQRTLLYRAFPRLNPDESNLNNTLSTVVRVKHQMRYKPHLPVSKGDANLLEKYEKELRENRLVDFDDLIFKTHDLFLARPEILNAFRDRFRHLLVDEFQDTDREQYALVRLLGEVHRSLFVVADDEQSIFGWRNADPENIDRFRRDVLGSRKPILLEENYRSSAEILALARELIAHNEMLFEREVRTQKRGTRVQGLVFDSFQAEGQFIAGDIWDRIRETSDLIHGDIAVLYPQHAIGNELEKIFMGANIPSQMAHRRGLFDQPVIRRALSVLKYALDGEDDANLELFLRRELEGVDPALYPALRDFQYRAELRSFKQAAFVYPRTVSEEEGLEVERALGLAGVVSNAVQKGATASLAGLVDDILDQLNTSGLPSLKNHLDQISDPMELSGMETALEQILPLYRRGGTVYITCWDEVLRFLLTTLIRDALARPGLTIREAAPGSRLELQDNACVLVFDSEPPTSSGPFLHVGGMVEPTQMGPMLVALKLCQAISCVDLVPYVPDYTVFDIETTDLDLDQAEIVEVGAVRVRDGKEVDTFHTLVRPQGTISEGARKTHGITDAELEGAPTFQEIYLKFQAFVGIDVMVAHNGYGFDFQVLHREARRNGRARMPNPMLDTLPMARSYCPEVRHNIDALCERYGIEKDGNRHRALDDARFLYWAFEGLKKERASRYRRMAHERLLDQVALGMLFQKTYAKQERFSHEDHLHFNLGAQRLLGPTNLCIRNLVDPFPRLEADRLRAQARMWLGEDPRPEALAAHAPDQIQRFRDLAERHGALSVSLQEGIRGLLDFADLYRMENEMLGRDAVHLLTLHAAKGLEFKEVYICGLEDRMLPNTRAVRGEDPKEMAEQRRLLYVGMTRAMDRLTLSCVRHRPGRKMIPSRFWEELQLEMHER